jgi:hypothetical protein
MVHIKNSMPTSRSVRPRQFDDLPIARHQYNEFEFGLFRVGQGFYPRIGIHGYSVHESRLGVVGFADINRINVTGFSEKGYPLESDLGIFISAALMYNFGPEKNNDYFFTGLGYYYGKQFWGPVMGLNLDDRKWHFLLMGQLSIQENVNSIPGVQSGFDPNSWYKLFFSRKINQQFSLGLYSERFYLSGLTLEYNLGSKFKRLGNLKLKAYLGQELEFGGTSFGLSLKIKTLDKYGGRS